MKFYLPFLIFILISCGSEDTGKHATGFNFVSVEGFLARVIGQWEYYTYKENPDDKKPILSGKYKIKISLVDKPEVISTNYDYILLVKGIGKEDKLYWGIKDREYYEIDPETGNGEFIGYIDGYKRIASFEGIENGYKYQAYVEYDYNEIGKIYYTERIWIEGELLSDWNRLVKGIKISD